MEIAMNRLAHTHFSERFTEGERAFGEFAVEVEFAEHREFKMWSYTGDAIWQRRSGAFFVGSILKSNVWSTNNRLCCGKVLSKIMIQ